MTDLLDDKLVLLYFQPDASAKRANADLVVRGQQEAIKAGDRVLVTGGNSSMEGISTRDLGFGTHPEILRLPDKYQTDKVMVTCPTCKFTYEHQHVFAEGTK